MTRHQNDREDLLAEASALVVRAELELPTFPEPVVIGFRREGQASVYFGQDRAYHFNDRNELRRAYVSNLLYRADAGRLASLDRRRVEGETQLIRHDLSEQETDEFLRGARGRLLRVRRHFDRQEFRVVREVAGGEDVAARISGWLSSLPVEIEIAPSPRVSG